MMMSWRAIAKLPVKRFSTEHMLLGTH